MKPSTLPSLVALFSIPWLLAAQTAPAPVPPDSAVAPSVTPLVASPFITPSASPSALAAPAAAVSPLPAPAAAATPAPMAGAASGPGGIRLNFQGAQLSDVLNYLSEAAGFIIVQETPVTGTVNVLSRQPLTADEAVDLLNTVLLEKNYVALRNGRILRIVSRTDAQKRDLPVITGADPSQIPRTDDMVTQILPVRYADVSKLIDNLRPLLSDNATITANDASNAIVLTDTQADVRRMAEIIRALDTSISGISTIHVYPLHYADAKSLADVLTQLFQSPSSSNASAQGNPMAAFFAGMGRRGGGPGGGGGGGGGGGPADSQPASAARTAASRVVAVADQQSNSVIVSAPDEFITTITEVVTRLDTNIADVTETRIFKLLHADATEMSGILSTLYSDPTAARNGQRGGGAPQNPNQNSNQNNLSSRALLQARMVAVADPRTNSVIISASHDAMEEIALTIGRLDSNDSKKQHIEVYSLDNADPDNVASILRGMFTVNGAAPTQTQAPVDALRQRTTTGASTDVANTLNTSGNSNNSRGSNAP